MQNKQVRIIQPHAENEFQGFELLKKRKRVCAYVRVSTDHLEQKSSYAAQVEEYTNRIESNPDWEFVGIYADEGISGTSTKKRTQFNTMLNNARLGEIDLIIIKSISRFARNTADCLNYIQEMRSINVDIFFEKENVYSSEPRVDFTLSIMSAIAQEEARNISENVKWNIEKRFKDGVPVVNTSRFLGYTKDKKGGNLIIVPEEAEIVKMIFNLYINNVGPKDIIKKLTEMGAKTGAGSKKWRPSTLTSILKNEKYCGDLLQQKTVTLDYLSHKKVKNEGIAPKYHIENNHEPIIDKETFMLAQQIRQDRLKSTIGENKNLSKYTLRYPYSSMIICSQCGRTLKRRYWNYGTRSQRVMQQCGGYIEGKGNCTAKATYQEMIEGATLDMLNNVFMSKTKVVSKIKTLIRNQIKQSNIDKDIEELVEANENISKKMSDLIDLKMSTNDLNNEIFNSKYAELHAMLHENNKEIKRLETENLKNHESKTRIDIINSYIDENTTPLKEVTADVLRAFDHKIISVSPNEIVYCVSPNKQHSDTEIIDNRVQYLYLDSIFQGTYYSEKYDKEMNYRVIII